MKTNITITNTNSNNEKAQKEIIYPKVPIKNNELRCKDEIVNLTTNLLRLNLSENEQRLYLYCIEIQPELARDNFPLYSKIQRQIDSELNKVFKRKFFSGFVLFGSTDNPPKVITINTEVDNIEYEVNLKLIEKLELEKINDLNDFEGINQRTKSFFEKILKDILYKNKNTIKFGDSGAIVKVNTKNVNDLYTKESIYHGYLTSAQVTEIGLFYRVLNVNKHILHITVYEKIKELRAINSHLNESQIRNVIDSYFKKYKTVQTTYGSLRAYVVDIIDFDASPRKTTFNITEGNNMKTITVEEYFKRQYNTKIMDPDQPLIRAETKAKKKKKEIKDNSGNIDLNKCKDDEDERIIYLVPELLYITGNQNETDSRNRKAIVNKTKMNPDEKLKAINSINELINSNSSKTYKTRDGKYLPCKTPSQVAKEWGISLGDNLEIKGRVLSQPHLIYGRKENIIPKNGKFMSGHSYAPVSFNINNFVYIYDTRDKSDIKNCLRLFIEKAKSKDININLQPKDIHGVGLNDCRTWENIYRNLNIIKDHANEIKMAIVFLSPQLEKFYSHLKDFFTNETKFASQFILSKKLQDQKRAGSIMFNIVEQINVKMGGTNFYIDFYKENIIPKNKIYMIMGLEIKQSSNGIDIVMTSSISRNLNKIITSVLTVQNNQEEKEKAINRLIELSLKELNKTGCPHPPDYIILYRQGGNKVQNKKLLINEVPIFTKILQDISKKPNINYKIKFIYICCNLKSDLKFFQKNNSNIQNPKSGLCVDSDVTQKGKYEFYIQPQFVNQGTATPCHYEVMYEDRDEPKEINCNGNKRIIDDNIKFEELEKLTFFLSFYFWTWAGAIRVPGTLKLASTCMDFYTKHLGGKLEKENKTFINPEYI